MFKKFSATILAVMIASTMSISVFADGVTYTGAPTEKWDFANGEFTESLNGVSSAEGRGYSSKYFSAKADKIYYLELINVTANGASGTITFTVINKNNGMVSKTLNYDDMVHSYSPEGSGGDSFGAALEFRADNDFYFEITTSNPQSAKFNGTYSIRESDLVHFNDITGHWAENTINKWADKGIVSGYPDGTFKPDNPVTRAELAKILTFAFDLKPSEYVYNEKDLHENDWYYNYLLCAGKYIPNYYLLYSNEKNQPYVDNITVNSFLPEQNAMRMHTADSIVEVIKNKDKLIIDVPEISIVKEELNKTFKDTEYESLMSDNHGIISDNVRRIFEYTYLANKLGIMQGDTDGYFRPYDNVTRAELITILDRIIAE